MITFVIALIAFVWIHGHHYRTMAPYSNIPAGEIIRESDLQYVHIITADEHDLAADTGAVIGHKALKQLPGGKRIHMSDIAR